MILDLDWLKEFVKLEHKPSELSEIFESLGFSSEKVTSQFLDLEITPNRGDCLSVLGLAREYAAKTRQEIKDEKVLPNYHSFPKYLKIEIESPELVPRYTGLIIKGVKVKPSSFSISQRLKRCGINPINSVVDATNLVMLEFGQPLHAFDLNKIKGNLRILKSNKPLKLETLDGVLRQIPADAIVIEDERTVIDLAGIMGSALVAIDSQSSFILLQAAIFKKDLIRTTSKKMNFSTEASLRYEREVDFEATKKALEKAANIILQNGGEIIERFDMVLNLPPHKKIPLELEYLSKLGGLKLNFDEVSKILKRLGIKGEKNYFIPPSFRHDIEFQEDLIEEILRSIDYKSIPQRVISKTTQKPHSFFDLKENLKDEIVHLGFNEVQTYSFLSQWEKEKAGFEAIKIVNPLSLDFAYLRPTLFPLLVKTIAKNPWASNIKIFEIGRVFLKNGKEEEHIGFATTNPFPPTIRQILGSKLLEIGPQHPLGLLYKLRRKVFVGEMVIDQFIKKFEEVFNKKLSRKKLPVPKEKIIFRSVSAFPPSVRDLAIVVQSSLSYEIIGQAIYQSDPRIFLVELFDEYTGPQVGVGKKNLAFHIIYQDPKKTLTKVEVNKIEKKLISLLEQKFKAHLRLPQVNYGG